MQKDRLQFYLKQLEDQGDDVIQEMIVWIQKEFQNTQASGIILGMSGGLDCCFVARLVQMAHIPLLLVLMPNGNSMDHGPRKDALELIHMFHMNAIELPVTKLVDVMKETVNGGLQTPVDTSMAFANISPIMRMGMLSTLAQAMNYVMIGTGNLTERSMGYFTKRGDGLSDFNPLGYLTKSEIRILASKVGIPAGIIAKAPSADLWEGQSDEDEMGIRIIDIDRYLLTKQGDENVVQKIIRAMQRSQHKRNPIPMFPMKREEELFL